MSEYPNRFKVCFWSDTCTCYVEGDCTVVSQGILVKYGNEILKLLEGVQKPKEVAAIRCKVH